MNVDYKFHALCHLIQISTISGQPFQYMNGIFGSEHLEMFACVVKRIHMCFLFAYSDAIGPDGESDVLVFILFNSSYVDTGFVLLLVLLVCFFLLFVRRHSSLWFWKFRRMDRSETFFFLHHIPKKEKKKEQLKGREKKNGFL